MYSVKSADGTPIGYTKAGQGPGLIIVGGAMGTAANYSELAEALSDQFTVYVPERRGRGMSPRPYVPLHRITTEIEDLRALVDESHARLLFGLSSGAVIALTATAAIPSIDKAVIYEPPFFFKSDIDRARIARFKDEVARKDYLGAMTTAGELVKLAPPPVQLLPRFLRRPLTKLVMRMLEGGPPYAPLSELIPAMRFDFDVVAEMSQQGPSFRSLDKEILLLGGTRIPRYLKDALEGLARTLPNARRVTLPGLDHAAPWNTDRGGKPQVVAEAMRSFYSAPPTTRR